MEFVLLSSLLALFSTGVENVPVVEIGVIVVAALLFGLLFTRFGQASSIGYILAGLVLGPIGLHFLVPGEGIAPVFSEIGLLMLLFYLGLELSIQKFKETGALASILVFAEMALISVAGYLVALAFGLSQIEAIVIGGMMPFASTVIVVKFIMERGLLATSEARIAISALIVEDFLAILVLVFLSTLTTAQSIGVVVFNGLLFVIAMFFIVRKLSNFVLRILDRYGHSDKMALYAIGIGIIVGYLGSLLGLSPILGAYFTGFALAETAYGERIKKKIGFFREFFVLFFFVSFGAAATLPTSLNIVWLLFALLAVFIVAKLLIYGVFGTAIGLSTKSAVTTGVLMMAIGEFSIIIANAGKDLLPNPADVLSLAFMLTIATGIIAPNIFKRIDSISALMAKLLPRNLSSYFSAVSSRAHSLQSYLSSRSVQSEQFKAMNRFMRNIVISIAVVYMGFLASHSIDFSFVPFVSPNWAFGVLLLPLVVWPVYKAVTELNFLVRSTVKDLFVAAFPHLHSKTHSVERKATEAVSGFLLTLVSALVSILTYYFNGGVFLLIPLISFFLSLMYLSRAVYGLFEEYGEAEFILQEAELFAVDDEEVKWLAKEFNERARTFRGLHEDRMAAKEEIQHALRTGNMRAARESLTRFKKREGKLVSTFSRAPFALEIAEDELPSRASHSEKSAKLAFKYYLENHTAHRLAEALSTKKTKAKTKRAETSKKIGSRITRALSKPKKKR
ncbi:MAG: cation:proton antiporter [Candidatus Micrarchaeota archaeon]